MVVKVICARCSKVLAKFPNAFSLTEYELRKILAQYNFHCPRCERRLSDKILEVVVE